LPELLDAAEREPVQDEVSAVRVLFELFGFLLKAAVSRQLSARFVFCAERVFFRRFAADSPHSRQIEREIRVGT
jgi:hypothetical protein